MKGELTCYDKTSCRFADEVRELRAALERANSKIAYYEGDGSVRAYEALVGTDAPRHKFTDEGICIRCGEDAEEWDAGCVEELAAEIEKKAAALEQARALVPFLRGWIETMQSEQGYEDEGTMAWRSWQDMIAEVENVIAALLAAAPGGAA